MKIESADIESQIIGILLNDSTEFSEIKKMICENDFSDEFLRGIFQVMTNLYHNIIPINFDNLIFNSSFNPQQHLYLSALRDECISTKNIISWCALLREKSVGRQLLKCADEIDEREKVALYFEELAGEVRSLHINQYWIVDAMRSSSEAFIALLKAIKP